MENRRLQSEQPFYLHAGQNGDSWAHSLPLISLNGEHHRFGMVIAQWLDLEC